jgi:hypothetical protein
LAPVRATNSATASTSPDTTVAATPLTAAIPSRPSHRGSSSSTAATAMAADAIPPRPARTRAITRLRSTTTRAASSSDNAPATYAAAISPCE